MLRLPAMHSTASSRRTRTLIAISVVALLLAQLLGLLHRIEHAGRGHLPSLAVAAKADLATLATLSAKAPSALKLLFGSHDAGSCDLYDQVTHGDALSTATAPLPAPAFTEAPAEVHPAWHLAAQAAGFLARGPPALS